MNLDFALAYPTLYALRSASTVNRPSSSSATQSLIIRIEN